MQDKDTDLKGDRNMKIERQKNTTSVVNAKFGAVVELNGEHFIVVDIPSQTNGTTQSVLVNLTSGKEKMVSDDTEVLLVNAVLKIF